MICKIGGNMNIKVYDKSGIQDMFRADVGSAGFDIRSNENVIIAIFPLTRLPEKSLKKLNLAL